MSDNSSTTRESIWREISDQAALLFPYFFIAYLLSLAISYFYPLSEYLNFIGFTLAILGLGIISLFSRKIPIVKNTRQASLTIFHWFLAHFYRSLGVVAFTAVCAYYGANVIELLIAFAGASSVLFLLDSRWSAGLALASLFFCPILLLFNYEAWAEQMAVYAFYFLTICVLTQIVDLKFEHKVIHSDSQ